MVLERLLASQARAIAFRPSSCLTLSALSVLLAVISFPQQAFPRWYVQCDANVPLGIDAVKATIEVVPTPVVHDGLAVWVGFNHDPNFQIQTGWHRLPSEPQTAYFEYNKEDGTHFVQDKWQPTTTDYSIYRDGNLIYVSINGFIVTAGLLWSDFDKLPMCDLQVGVELFAPDEHVPGQSGDTLDITGISYRRIGSSIYQSPSLSNYNDSVCGHISSSVTSLSTWDGRDFFTDTCP